VADSAWSEAELAGLPAWTLVQAYHAVAQGFHALFSEHQMTPIQFGVLAQLAATPGLTQAELARRVLIRPQSMNELITSLVDRGLLVREGPGGKGRPVPVSLTDEGRAALNRAGEAVRAFNDPAALGMTAAEAGQFNELLHQLIRSRSRPV
jgi:DNA-binding MarR family transcriptional regulator